MRNVTGSPVEGDDFFGREDEVATLLRQARNGNHVLLLAPRRMGKSSLVAEVSRRLEKESGWKIIKADVQDASDEPAFFFEIHQAIKQSGVKLSLLDMVGQHISDFRRNFRGSKVQEIMGDESWETAAESIKQLFAEIAKQGQVLFTLDELPIFLTKLSDASNGPERVKSLLHWLRSTRHKCGAALPWLLCGSIGFRHIRRTKRTIWDYQRVVTI